MGLIILGMTFEGALRGEIGVAIDAVVLRPGLVVLLLVMLELGCG